MYSVQLPPEFDYLAVFVFFLAFCFFSPESNECAMTSPPVCPADFLCIDTLASFFCLPYLVNATPSLLTSMSGGDTLSLEVQFASTSSFIEFSQPIDDQYQLAVSYGIPDRVNFELDLISTMYDTETNRLTIEATTSAGSYMHCPYMHTHTYIHTCIHTYIHTV